MKILNHFLPVRETLGIQEVRESSDARPYFSVESVIVSCFDPDVKTVSYRMSAFIIIIHLYYDSTYLHPTVYNHFHYGFLDR